MFRRDVLKAGFGTAVLIGAGGLATACSPAERPAVTSGVAGSPSLLSPDRNGVMLPVGFASRVVARSWQIVPGTTFMWHDRPDGGAVFERDGGWTYVSNCESFPGGVSALDFGSDGRVVAGRSLVHGFTMSNCAGGATPWGTWLTCEEWDFGRVIECDPSGRRSSVERPALGWFAHEAVAVDPVGRALYLTEDRPDGGLYRFVPDRWGDLTRGTLTIAVVDDAGAVRWAAVPRPNPGLFDTPTRRQVPGSTEFVGGEGTVLVDGHVYFTTKGDNRVWDLDTRSMVLEVLYDAATSATPHLRGVDNITSRGGDLYVAEDGGDMELVLLRTDGTVLPFLRIVGQGESEIAGPAFDPSGTRLYFSSQRGTDGTGITYEVAGPFADFARGEVAV